ncbi:MAG TPA: DUF4136 domain-containing protein [Gemmatimonadales bacterium]|nr:DUF4136 domain-containing protein [Gemmatimonadales bacterium]
MRGPVLAAVAAMAWGATACAPALAVHTDVDPGLSVSDYRTFSIRRATEPLGGVAPALSDLTLTSTSTERAVRSAIAADLERRGYVQSDSSPDLLVTYYLAPPPQLELSEWESGYIWRPSIWRDWGPTAGDPTPAEYANGAVIIDILDASTNALVWRGHAVAPAAEDDHLYQRNLGQSVAAIIRQLPESSPGLALKGAAD